MYTDDDYIKSYSYHTPKPKCSLKCKLCHEHEWKNNFRRGCLIVGYGRVDPKILDERNIMDQVNNLVVSKASMQVDMNAVEQMIKSGRVSVSTLAEKFGVSSATMKALIMNKWGNTVEFKRGRSGGVSFKQA